ncbi:hypothetical protein Sango_3113200 [Sesamum angolense]|uniref:Reverse transcriptase domain-containing protein n=1 Tax=Sesamum angolense TaxID=2727404 RepID=A0AAE1T979_9LAMI|nr:hypothetical protein Sango_3113200 [Sesamum angolense]
MEISMLQQRAKLRWLKHGDQSSKVFFRKINASRVKQRVYQITKHIPFAPAEASLLIAPVTRSEVKEAFFDIDVESAVGPDGFTSAFYRTAWPVVGQAIFQAVGEFFRTGKLLKQINSTLIALIPKVNLPLYVSDYRPISCCNVLYKAITKIIVTRIQRILPLMIDYSQNGFVPGRSITDNILLAQELLAGYNQMRLHHRSSFSVSINGSIHGFFKGGRGLRQGDPMSPYLFVLVRKSGTRFSDTELKKQPNSNTTGSLKINPAKSQIIYPDQCSRKATDPAVFGVSRRHLASQIPRLEPPEPILCWPLQLIKSVLSTLHMYLGIGIHSTQRHPENSREEDEKIPLAWK